METKSRHAGATGKAPLLGQPNAVMPILFRGRNSRAAMRKTFRIQTTTSPSPTAGNTSRGSLGSVGFQTCRIADSFKSAGREVAPAVGLEICAAADERGILFTI